MILISTLYFWRHPEIFPNSFTATFMHSDIGHFASNALGLVMLGYLIISWYGLRVYPVYCVALSFLVNYLTLKTYPEGTKLVGASGLVYLMAGFWLTSFTLVHRSQGFGKRVLRALGVTLGTLMPTTFEPRVSYRAHAIGFVVGLVFALIWFLYNYKWIRSYEVVVIPQPEELEEAQGKTP